MPYPRAVDRDWTFDYSRAPIVVIRLPGGGGGPPDIEAMRRDADAMLARRTRIVVVHDLTHARPDAGRRRRAASWVEANSAEIRRYVVGYAVIAPTALQRGIFVAIQWLARPSVPMQVFAELAPALAWAEKRAADAGLSPSR
ncbi:MAG: hypothetical protein FJ104_05170 [Deltaproteobacteria bacterium]|nr:hypothetical protein [Deltaproteobacteria bacterium]